MDWWLSVAEPLFHMSTIMKSQAKIDGERLRNLKRYITVVGVAWRNKITYKQPVFWKMHTVECALICFVTIHGMCGRVSAEGFERKHYDMSALKTLLAPMVKTSDRVQKISQRQQVSLLPGMAKIIHKMQPKKIGRRGTYRTKTAPRREENLPERENVDDWAPDGFFKIESGGYLADVYQTVYNYCHHTMIPDYWKVPFPNCDGLGNFAKLKSEFFGDLI
jgi:hypothetical protein